MYAAYAVNGVSDGTFTQHPQLYRPAAPPAPLSLLLHQCVCEEMVHRTQLACDALTDFQRIVGLCVAERHGRWTFTVASGASGGGSSWSCPRCGCTQEDAERAASEQKEGVWSPAFHRRGVLDECVTPYCSAEELRKNANHCRYAADTAAQLDRRYAFQQEFGGLLQRIQAASRGIQDSTTR